MEGSEGGTPRAAVVAVLIATLVAVYLLAPGIADVLHIDIIVLGR